MPAQGRELVSEEESVANAVALAALGPLRGVPIRVLTFDGPWRPASIGACVVGASSTSRAADRRHGIDGDSLVEQTRRGTTAIPISDIGGLDHAWCRAAPTAGSCGTGTPPSWCGSGWWRTLPPPCGAGEKAERAARAPILRSSRRARALHALRRGDHVCTDGPVGDVRRRRARALH